MKMVSNKTLELYGPIIFFESYLTLSVILFAFGPWDWPVENATKLYSFLAVMHLFLYLGYASVIRKIKQYSHNDIASPIRIPSLVAIGSLASLVVNLISYLLTRKESLGLIEAVADPARAYAQTAASELMKEATSPVSFIRFLFAPLILLAIPVGIMNWERISKIGKILVCSVIVSNLGIWLLTGRNKGLADLVLIIPWFIIARLVSKKWIPRRIEKSIILIIFVIAIIFFFSYFAENYEGRMGIYGSRMSLLGIDADYQNLFVSFFPDKMRYGVAGLISYATNGYYGLSLAMELPYRCCYGAGHSLFLHNIVLVRVFGLTSVMERSYPYRVEMESGWLRLGHWHSIYTWLASDLSFYGVLFAVFIIGKTLAISWLDTVSGGNVFAPAVLYLTLMMVYYFPANNQVLAFADNFIGFWIIVALWLLTRRGILFNKRRRMKAMRLRIHIG